MIIPMIILCIASIFIGYIFKDLYIGLGSSFNSIFIHPNNLNIIDTEFSIPIYIKLLPLFLTILSIIFILILYEFIIIYFNNFFIYNNIFFKSIYIFMNNKFMLDKFFNNFFIRYFFHLSFSFNHFIDKGLLHTFGPTGLYNSLNILSYNILSLSNYGPFIYSSSSYTIKHYSIYLISTILFILLSFYFNYSLIILFIILLF
jgi:NADH-ubiquinone oxidoreductase chain 5